MKLGFGLYRHMLKPAYFEFARQVGATHVVVHLVDYFKGGEKENPRRDQPVGELAGWGTQATRMNCGLSTKYRRLRKRLSGQD